MDNKYNFLRLGGPCPTDEQLLDTELFYHNAVEIISRFDEWADKDRFYFIPLYMRMTYSLGWVAEIAPDPVWLGSFVRNSREHPELFQCKCPECGGLLLPHYYNGSPVSGRVDMSCRCKCGWEGSVTVSGWHHRAIALRDRLAEDAMRYRKYRLLHPLDKKESVGTLSVFLDLVDGRGLMSTRP